MSLDSNNHKFDPKDGGLSGTDSNNDPEADLFNRARQDVIHYYIVHVASKGEEYE